MYVIMHKNQQKLASITPWNEYIITVHFATIFHLNPEHWKDFQGHKDSSVDTLINAIHTVIL